MRNKNIIYIVLGIFLSLCLVSITDFIPSENYSSDINNQEKTPLQPSAGEIIIITPENKTYTSAMSGYYSATYSFDEDNVGENPNNWVVSENGGSCNVITEIDGHTKVIELYDTSDSDYPYVLNYFDNNKTTGIVEWWWCSDSNTDVVQFLITDADNSAHVNILTSNTSTTYIQYYDDTTHNIAQYLPDTWYHMKVQFDVAGQWYLWINGAQYGPYNYQGTPQGMDRFYVGMNYDPSNYYCYIDAVGYSWDSNYELGSNIYEGLLLSFENSTNLKWIGYSLDFQTNKTVKGNTAINLPNNGTHSIQVFGNDTFGTNYSSELRYFTIDIPECHIDKQTTIGSSEPFNEEDIKLNDGIFDETTFGGGYGNQIHIQHADTILGYRGLVWGTSPPRTEEGDVNNALRENDNVNIFLEADKLHSYTPGTIFIQWGNYQNFDSSIHQYLTEIRINYEVMAEAGWWPNILDTGSNLRLYYYDNFGTSSSTLIASVPVNQHYYSGVISLTSGTIFNHVKSGGYIKSMKLSMYSGENGLLDVTWINIDYIDIYYYFDKPDIDFEYQFNCSDYGFENITEFDLNMDIMETISVLNVHLWNFETDQWDIINTISSAGFYSRPIDTNADHYFNEGEVFVIRFESMDYWDGRPYTYYHIRIDFIEIRIPPPDPPPNLIAYQEFLYIRLNWDDSHIYGAPVLHYNIYRGESEGEVKTLIATSSNTEFIDTDLEFGITYYYGISANSYMGESNTSNIQIMFRDPIDPVWNPEPEDHTIELGDHFSYDVNADDLSAITYSINDTTNFVINSGTGLITNAIDLVVDEYWLEITAEDLYGNDISAIIKITVEDTTDPIWSPDPEDQIIEFGDPLNYEVNADDLSTITYSINDTTNFAINNGTGLITNATDLEVGKCWLEITAVDPYNHGISTIIKLTVQDTTGPVWNPEPIYQFIEFGDPLNYEVNADDLSTITYSINDTTNFAINSGTGLITNATALTIGEYWLEITAEDQYSNNIITIIKIFSTVKEISKCNIDKQTNIGYSEPFNEGFIKIDDGIYDQTYFGEGYRELVHRQDVDRIIDYRGRVWGTKPPMLPIGDVNNALKYNDNFNLYLEADWAGGYTPGTIFIQWGNYQNFDSSLHQYLTEIRIYYEVMAEAGWPPNILDTGSNLRLHYYDNAGHSSSKLVASTPSHQQYYFGGIHLTSGIIFDHVKSGGYIESMKLEMYSGENGFFDVTWINIDYIDIYYYFDKHDIDFEYQFNCSEYGFENITEFDLNMDIMETISGLNVHLWNFETDQWDIINTISSAGFHSQTIDSNANHYFDMDEIFIIRFETCDYWDGGPYTDYHIRIDFIEIRVPPPEPPPNLIALQEFLYIHLNWDDSLTYGAPVLYYNIFRGESEGAVKTLIAISGNTEFNDNDVEFGITYYYEISAYSYMGESNTSNVEIMFQDTIDPVWNPEPEDQGIKFGSPFSYEVNADDLSAITYFINDTTHFAINSGTGLITNATALTVGEYWLEITAEDQYGNDITKIIKITVEDTIDPVWNPNPEDQTIEFGDPFSYEVNADDLSAITYFINDTTHFVIDSGTGLITNAIDLAVGEYWLEITAEDQYGNDITTIIRISVEDTTDPIWNPNPEDQTIELGDPFSYKVNADDLSAITYFINDTTHFVIDSGTGLITNATALAIGDYWLEITAEDPFGNYITAMIKITVEDTTGPVWNPNPEDQTIELGDPFSYEVNADDLSAIAYSINDTTHFAINSGTGLITNATALTVGVYWLEITAEDQYGNDITAMIRISVEDTTDPIWNPNPEDQTIELGDPFSYEVNTDDLSGVIYSVNDTTHFAINSGTGLITNATNLAVGDYWLEITATDPYGNDITTVIKITVEDTTGPVWNPNPEDQTIELGDSFSYEVNADDISTIAYSINDTTHFSIDSGTGQITNATALTVGEYWLEITATDPYGSNITAMIKITVEDTTGPVWNPDPEDQKIELGDSFSYEVNANDLSGVIYSVNDTTYFAINSGTGLITNAIDLAVGEYWLQITAIDPYGNDISTIIKLTVEKSTSQPSAIPGFEILIVSICIIITWIGIIVYDKKKLKI